MTRKLWNTAIAEAQAAHAVQCSALLPLTWSVAPGMWVAFAKGTILPSHLIDTCDSNDDDDGDILLMIIRLQDRISATSIRLASSCCGIALPPEFGCASASAF